jgi:hypothetical protein
VRQQAQPLRDQIGSPLTPAPEKERFRARLRDLYRDLPRPDGCLDLPGEPRDPLPAAPLGAVAWLRWRPGLHLAGNSYRGIAINACVAGAGPVARAALSFP